ncbi:hypothetical protein NVIE_004080 [Nitrososphaera viennensis EN76]|uniref:Uncharacterized protein n=1 Tax=Nitrososphaera viennensis EN76 TaxID=926571 RepID=A0A060HLZ4_9ARCH|nr:hypothetical protein NVIE_004080 [Nitrososphaera viennensis EN76]
MSENVDAASDWLARMGVNVEKLRVMGGLTDSDVISLYHFLRKLLEVRSGHSTSS